MGAENSCERYRFPEQLLVIDNELAIGHFINLTNAVLAG
jgi:hypothetical protein